MINSIEIFMIIIMTWCGALGGVFLKKASQGMKKINIQLIVGLGLYGLGAILNIILLKFLPLTIVFPCNALTYIWATIMGKIIFKERINRYNISGLVFIGIGLCFLVL